MPFNPIVFIVAAVGGYMLLRLRFFFIIHPIRTGTYLLRTVGRRDTARSLFLALGGTLGVGNIFGVAVGLILGGAGSVFWMLVSSVFAAVLKYSEVTLSSDALTHTAGGKHGGMFRIIRDGFGRLGGALSIVYAAATLLVAFSMGAALQTHTFVAAAGEIFDTPPTLSAALYAFLVLLTVVGGAKIIERVNEILIPLTTIVYISLALAILVIYRERLPAALGDIFRSALLPRAAGGGVVGFLTSRAVSEGFARGLLSNEAGSGTSSMAHARGGELNPAMSGLMGIVEVIFDTVILCTLTALVLLVSVPDVGAYSEGMDLALAGFVHALGRGGGGLLAACILAFSYSTVTCWYFYGCEAYSAIFGTSRPVVMLPLYLCAIVLGARAPSGVLVFVTDTLLLVMTAITGAVIIKSSDRIVHLSERGGVLTRRGINIRLFRGVKSAKRRPRVKLNGNQPQKR